jgi:galactan endo-1,6-beta-galactosidase
MYNFSTVTSWLHTNISEALTPHPKHITIHASDIKSPSKNIIWEGWGCSLCWWAKVYGDRKEIADLFFTLTEGLPGPLKETIEPETKQPSSSPTSSIVSSDINAGAGGDSDFVKRIGYPGLGMNIVRYNAGASSDRPALNNQKRMQKSPNINPKRLIDTFWINESSRDPQNTNSWDWEGVDLNQRQALLMAKERDATIFELFSNAPPWWMCINNNPSGGSTRTTENLKSEHVDDFAYFMSTVAKEFERRWGVHFQYVSAFNESESTWWHHEGNQEGCHFKHETRVQVLEKLQEYLNKQFHGDDANNNDSSASLVPRITYSDACFYTHATESIQKLIFPTLHQITSSISKWNVHGYQPTGPRSQVSKLIKSLPPSSSSHKIWQSEYGDGDGSGIEMARNLIRDIRYLKPSAYCYWQPIDETGGWGLFRASLEPQDTVAHLNAKYFVFAHFSRHLRPGCKILHGLSEVGWCVVGFDEVDGKGRGKVVVVVLNQEERERELEISFDGFEEVNGPVSWWETRVDDPQWYYVRRRIISGDNYQQSLRGSASRFGWRKEGVDGLAGEARFFFAMPPRSIHTFEIENCVLQC